MSKSIDERVVEMQFDNQQFEKGISTSVKSLDKLKKSLKLDDAGRSFEKLERSAKNVRLDGLASSVDAISNKFTLMGRMSIAWMDNIAHAAVNAGKRIVNALTVDPVRSGFNEYELKMDAIKTFQSTHPLRGATAKTYKENCTFFELADKLSARIAAKKPSAKADRCA